FPLHSSATHRNQNSFPTRRSSDLVLGESDDMKGQKVEMIASRRPSPEEMEAYERILGDALSGDRTNFAREDYVEEAWRIVDPILDRKSTRLNSSHEWISYAVFCLK